MIHQSLKTAILPINGDFSLNKLYSSSFSTHIGLFILFAAFFPIAPISFFIQVLDSGLPQEPITCAMLGKRSLMLIILH